MPPFPPATGDAPQQDAPRSSRCRNATRPVLAALLIAGASSTLGGCLGYDGGVTHGYQIDPQAASDVKTGQSAEQVLVTLGTPSTTSTVGGTAWYYISQKTDRSIAFMQPTITDRKIYAVYFDKGKKVVRTGNYSLQDGKVIDVATGTTPTFGADQSVLKGLFFNFNPFQSMMGRT